jgi:adenylate cyclase
MNVYNDYITTIEEAINADPSNRSLHETVTRGHQPFAKAFTYEEFNKRLPKDKLQPSLEVFSKEVGLLPNFNQKLGLHPDFAHLKYSDQLENHYIVSMFVDVKGSTNLFKRYSPETVLIITNTIQRAAIHTCLILGGYVHRLQGDGLLVYFGGKRLAIQQAVSRSLQFGSMLTYFVENDLRKVFDLQGIERIYTRIGIDLGYDEAVVWALAGIGEISEVTTCSLHTSLACKMQAHANKNGIVVGDNVVKEVSELRDLFTAVCHRTNDPTHRYIFQNPEKGFRYTQYDFAWLPFLKRQSYVATDLYGNLQLKTHNVPTAVKAVSNLASIASINKPYSI